MVSSKVLKRRIKLDSESISSLSSKVKRLSAKDKLLFNRFYSLSERDSFMKIPKSMIPWVKSQFGSVNAVTNQKIIDVRNKFTFEAAAFNELRSMRPSVKQPFDDKDIRIESGDNFSKPEQFTPIDEFGRLKGKYSTTCANVAKYDAFHSLIIFKEHNPLKFTEAELKDHLDTADKWFSTVNKKNRTYCYPFLMWNCLWRSAASIIHGHMQMLMTEGQHYPKLEMLNQVKEFYKEKYEGDYFEDLIKIHEVLGLTKKYKDFTIVVYLTPVKEKEILIFSNDKNKLNKNRTIGSYSWVLNKVLSSLLKLGVNSFNMACYIPPIGKEKNNAQWKGFPLLFRITDRGNLASKTTDIGGMELYAGLNIIESDPFKLIKDF
ncbi:hypothetical protein COV13_03185 [Candidatus Woesearchaeota archaeon CG10_big_fil_rev_8_21_14_0_10_32_9]|nr:MAG: hypothetical protein COV13_03185 [Candidatus Woesearchaeota archaeon CG10_big_fil_rev_8_21_14_0_10_32_9]